MSALYFLRRDADLGARNTFGVAARAPWLLEVFDTGTLAEALQLEQIAGLPLLPLGGGSNLLFAGDAPGAVLALRAAGMRVLGDLAVDGVVATNTTVARTAVQGHRHAGEAGGLSGAPLMGQATLVLRRMRARLPESIPLVGVGGILSGADAVAKMAAGASLVQCYTGLVYRGPELVGECVDAMRRRKESPSRGTASAA